jgi:hypothetical protein
VLQRGVILIRFTKLNQAFTPLQNKLKRNNKILRFEIIICLDNRSRTHKKEKKKHLICGNIQTLNNSDVCNFNQIH